jgi:1,4-dihydroxy-2-naphthoyl-CoA synthase
VDGFADLTDITYHRHITEPTVRVAFNRPEVRNAFRPRQFVTRMVERTMRPVKASRQAEACVTAAKG